jgi:primosomal protein N' (replication factor Y)
MLRMTRWIAEHYLCSWGQVLEAVVPSGVRSQAGTRQATFFSVNPETVAGIADLKLPPAQAEVIRALTAAGKPLSLKELEHAAGCSQGPIAALRRKGLIRETAQRVSIKQAPAPVFARQGEHALNPDQQAALDAILGALQSRQQQTILVHGVTGSGKTEVYIRAIQEVASFGRQAIVLVPEISLTPQTLERFRARFDRVALLHSHLSDAQRHHEWQRIADGQVQVVVGARSAVFAPTRHLGLIVLDEEHESTFKQETAPRYHARDVALARARDEKVPLVLGSATPALESWHKAQTGEYRLVSLPKRVFDRPMPSVGTIDLRLDEHSRATRGTISRLLHRAMVEALEEGGQVILLLNRRGYSTHIQCPACGHVVRCPNCEIALTLHRTEQKALCHYCDFQAPAPAMCPECRFRGIRFRGYGTQRLEAEVQARFPGVTALRMDTDSMQRRGSHEEALAAFRSGAVRILLGTQMIAKGLDFPNVTLVGVVHADTVLHFPDFRAAERTFQLITQVAGRTGRGEKGGRVLVQTFNPDHPAIVAAVRHDYAAFAASELPSRQMFSYPPFASMVRLVIRGPQEPIVKQFAEYLGQRLTAALDSSVCHFSLPAADETSLPANTLSGGGQAVPHPRVLGPAPAPFPKLRGLYRYQIQLQGPDGEQLRQAVRQATSDLQVPEHVQWIADVDPLDML